MVETSRSSRFLVVSPAEGTAKKLPKSKQCPKKISSVLWALRSCLCGCCCCCCSACAAAPPPGATDDRLGDAQKDDQQRGTSSFNRGLLGLMEGLATCRRPPSGALGPEKNFPASQHAAKVSDSQIDFFKMLDERIENGPDDESLDESRNKLFSRPASDGDPRHGAPTTGGSHPSALHRRWSASKITNPRTPSSPEDPGSNVMRMDFFPDSRSAEPSQQVEGGPLERLMPDVSDLESPSDDASSSDQPKENFKEHYVFLGNIYTVTRPATRKTSPTADRSPSPALVAVTPRMTEEELHLQTLLDNSVPCYQNERMLGGELSPEIDANQFWMDFDASDSNEKQASKVAKARAVRSLPCDIVRPCLSGLKPVIE